MRSNINRIIPTKHPINLFPSPHIIQLKFPTSTSSSQPRNLRKRKSLIGSAICSVDDENVHALGRSTRVILWWGSDWGVDGGVEWGSWSTYDRVLVECQKVRISYDSHLVRREITQLQKLNK